MARVTDDPVLWFAYRKRRPRAPAPEIHRDRGWDVLQAAGFDTVRLVAIDAEWAALRFRRATHIRRQ